MSVVVELLAGYMCEVPESIPLRTALRVQGPEVVVADTRDDRVDGMGKGLACKGGDGGLIQRKAGGSGVSGMLRVRSGVIVLQADHLS